MTSEPPPWIIVIRSQSASITCGELVITVVTATSQHLWLVAAYKEPLLKPLPPQDFPPPRVHRLNYEFAAEFGLEQTEPGNVYIHTFRFKSIMPLGRLYYQLLLFTEGGFKRASSPIYAFDINPTELVQETWPNGLPGTLGWTYSVDPPGVITSGTGYAGISYIGPLGLGTLGLNFTTVPALANLLPCNAYVMFELSSGTHPVKAAEMRVTLTQSSISPPFHSNAFLLVRSVDSTTSGSNNIYALGNAATGPIGFTSGTWNVGQVFFHAQNDKPANSAVTDPTIPWTGLTFSFTAGNTLDPLASAGFFVGKVSIGTLDPTPVRVDRVWRYLDAPIFKILDLTP